MVLRVNITSPGALDVLGHHITMVGNGYPKVAHFALYTGYSPWISGGIHHLNSREFSLLLPAHQETQLHHQP